MSVRNFYISERAFRRQKVRIVILLIIIIFFVVAGYLFSINTISMPLTQEHFEYYEQLAHNIYLQKEPIIIDDLEGVEVSISVAKITVKPSDFTYRGYIVAKQQNSELVMTRYFEIGEAIVFGFIIGLIFLYMLISLCIFFQDLYKKIRFRNSGKNQ